MGIFLIEYKLKWTSKAPGKKVSVTNLLQLFDLTSWLLILVSMVVMSLMLITVHNIQQQFGGENQDISLSIITPLAMLTAENMSGSVFNSRTNQLFARNFLLLLWSDMGMIIVFGFVCNLRAMLLKPARDRPIDTTEELFLQGKSPIVVKTQLKQSLETSPNVWQRKAAQNARVLGDPRKITTSVETLIQNDGTHAMALPVLTVIWRLKGQEKQIPLHFSEENLYSYYLGWVMAKKSPWKTVINNHIGLYKQAGLISKSINLIHTKRGRNFLNSILFSRQDYK